MKSAISRIAASGILYFLSLNTLAFSKDVEQLLRLPEEKIDVGLAALIFAKEVYPEIDVQAYSKRIDALAEQARLTIQRYGPYDPESVVRALNTFYYKEHGIQYDKSPNGKQKPENYFINGILDTGKGQCVTLPLLYIAIAQRLGYPVYPVFAPEHSFVRFVSPNLKERNIDLSSGASFQPDTGYIHNLNISEKGLRSGAYLRTLTYRQYLGNFLQQNALVFAGKGDLDTAITYFERAVSLDPKTPSYHVNLYFLHMRKAAREPETATSWRHRQNATRYFLKAEELGFTYDPDANTRNKK